MNIALVDDCEFLLFGVKEKLSHFDEIDKILVCSNIANLSTILSNNKVDVALVDLCYHGTLKGYEVAESIRREFPSIKTVAFSWARDFSYMLRAVRNGMSGYILKDSTTEQLLEALQQIHSNDRFYLSASIRQYYLDQTTNKSLSSKDLTPTEEKILKLICSGNSNKEIAFISHSALGTIEKHIQNIKRKTNTRNRVEVSNYAIIHGYVIPDELREKYTNRALRVIPYTS